MMFGFDVRVDVGSGVQQALDKDGTEFSRCCQVPPLQPRLVFFLFILVFFPVFFLFGWFRVVRRWYWHHFPSDF